MSVTVQTEVPRAKILTPIKGSPFSSVTVPVMERCASIVEMPTNASARTSESLFILIQFCLKNVYEKSIASKNRIFLFKPMLCH